MARPSNLASMSVDALIKMRDDIGKILSGKVDQLQSQLAALADGGWVSSGKQAIGRPKGSGSALKGTKVAPKYRNPKNRSETWAGRGAMPRWMAAEIKKGKKRESFLIDKAAAKPAKAKRAPVAKAKKRGRPAKKRQAAARPAGNGATAAGGENT
jgi:DNA-binding protein H-NS